MRTLASLGTGFFLAGTFFFTHGLAGHSGSLILGSVVGLLGLFLLGIMASNVEPSSPASEVRANRPRRRPSAGMRSLRVRRTPVGAGGGR